MLAEILSTSVGFTLFMVFRANSSEDYEEVGDHLSFNPTPMSPFISKYSLQQKIRPVFILIYLSVIRTVL